MLKFPPDKILDEWLTTQNCNVQKIWKIDQSDEVDRNK